MFTLLLLRSMMSSFSNSLDDKTHGAMNSCYWKLVLRILKSCCRPVGYSIEFLKAVVQQAMVYIRPLQWDLIIPCEDSEAKDVSSAASP